MTELEIMQRAKMYMDKLANGINPITDRPVPESDAINNVRLSRCFFYVSDVLRQVIENGGVRGKAARTAKLPFSLTYAQTQAFSCSDDPIPVTAITERINVLRTDETMKKLRYTSITQFLTQSGMLTEIEISSGKKAKRPTEAGRSIGIFTEERVGQNGPYTVVLYDQSAQQFLMDNIDGIIAINNAPKEKAAAAELP